MCIKDSERNIARDYNAGVLHCIFLFPSLCNQGQLFRWSWHPRSRTCKSNLLNLADRDRKGISSEVLEVHSRNSRGCHLQGEKHTMLYKESFAPRLPCIVLPILFHLLPVLRLRVPHCLLCLLLPHLSFATATRLATGPARTTCQGI